MLNPQITIHKNIRAAYFEVSQRLPIEDIKVRQRLDRAYEIVNGHGYDIEPVYNSLEVVIIDSWLIHKESTSLLEDNHVQYCVDSESCTCPDYTTARGGLCKHRIAVILVQEMMKL